MPRLALTVRLKTGVGPSWPESSVPTSGEGSDCPSPAVWKTLKTSVVAPPMSTPSTSIPLRRAMACMILPTAAGVGMIGAAVHDISFE